ncbi:MAG: hypothetical protein ABUL72_06295 [Armatimonadota bacterium]
MKAASVFGGLAVLGLFGGGLYALKKGYIHLPGTKKPKVLTLSTGTTLPLILVDSLSSGGAKEGQEVTLLTTEDIKLGKQVILERGTKVIAEVTKSRGATAMTAVANQPARLEITLKPVTMKDGKTIKIKGSDGPLYAFTQANTKGRKDASKIDRLWETPEGRSALESLKSSTTDGGLKMPDPESLKKVADAVGLEKTRKFLNAPRSDQALSPDKLLGALSKGDMMTLTGVDQVLGVQALGEIAYVGKAVDDKLRGIFKGNNIEAPIGTPVLVKTAEPYQITIEPES